MTTVPRSSHLGCQFLILEYYDGCLALRSRVAGRQGRGDEALHQERPLLADSVDKVGKRRFLPA
jgi:hypothetical protein